MAMSSPPWPPPVASALMTCCRAPRRRRDLLLALIIARLLDPAAKLATARMLDPATTSHSLGETLGLGAVPVREICAALDWLGAEQTLVENSLAFRHLREGALVLYDVTSSYLEGRHCPLLTSNTSTATGPGSVYNRSSLSTHTATGKKEVIRVHAWVRLVLCDLLEVPPEQANGSHREERLERKNLCRVARGPSKIASGRAWIDKASPAFRRVLRCHIT
jgi:hypothetical protein